MTISIECQLDVNVNTIGTIVTTTASILFKDVSRSIVNSPLLDVGIVSSAPSVCSSDDGDSVMTLESDIYVDELSGSNMLHLDAAYVLKKDDPQEEVRISPIDTKS